MPVTYSVAISHNGATHVEIKYDKPQDLTDSNQTIIASLKKQFLPRVPIYQEPAVGPFETPGYIKFNKITNAIDILITNNANIIRLSLGASVETVIVTDDIIRKLMMVIKYNTIKHLKFVGIEFNSEEAVLELSQALRNNTSLKTIDIYNHNLSEKGVYALATIASMQRMTSWQEFNISPTNMNETSIALLVLAGMKILNPMPLVATETVSKMLSETIAEYNSERDRSKLMLWLQYSSFVPKTTIVKQNFAGYLFNTYVKNLEAHKETILGMSIADKLKRFEKMSDIDGVDVFVENEKSVAQLTSHMPVLRRDLLRHILSFLPAFTPLKEKQFYTPEKVLKIMKFGNFSM